MHSPLLLQDLLGSIFILFLFQRTRGHVCIRRREARLLTEKYVTFFFLFIHVCVTISFTYSIPRISSMSQHISTLQQTLFLPLQFIN